MRCDIEPIRRQLMVGSRQDYLGDRVGGKRDTRRRPPLLSADQNHGAGPVQSLLATPANDPMTDVEASEEEGRDHEPVERDSGTQRAAFGGKQVAAQVFGGEQRLVRENGIEVADRQRASIVEHGCDGVFSPAISLDPDLIPPEGGRVGRPRCSSCLQQPFGVLFPEVRSWCEPPHVHQRRYRWPEM